MHQALQEKKLEYFKEEASVVLEMCKERKIGKKQMQRVYDILGLYHASESAPVNTEKILSAIRNRITEQNMVSIV